MEPVPQPRRSQAKVVTLAARRAADSCLKTAARPRRWPTTTSCCPTPARTGGCDDHPGSHSRPGRRRRHRAACRILRLPSVRSRYGEIAAAATRQQASYQSFLFELLSVECEERLARRRIRLVREANFPRTKRLADFDFDTNPNVPAALIHTLAKGAWIKAGQPVCLVGDSGTGKSHLLIGLGTAAADAGCPRVRSGPRLRSSRGSTRPFLARETAAGALERGEESPCLFTMIREADSYGSSKHPRSVSAGDRRVDSGG
jgi:hypothetical protein